MDPLLPFVLGGLFSPGPNIILLTTSGARFGFRATVPHLLGVALGVGVIAAVAGLGVAAAVMALPALAWALRVAAAGWILWLAWTLLNAQARPAAAAGENGAGAGAVAGQAAGRGDRPPEAATGAHGRAGAGRPFTFWQAVLFQWVNPKVWAVAIAAAAGFPADLPPVAEALRLGGVFSSLNLFVCLFWTWAGSLLTFLLDTPRAWRAFMAVMALVLAGSAAMILV